MRRRVAIVLTVMAGAAAMWVFMQTPSVTAGGERRDCPGTSLVGQLLGGSGSAQRSSAVCETAADRLLYSGGGLSLLAVAAATTAAFSGRELELSSRP